MTAAVGAVSAGLALMWLVLSVVGAVASVDDRDGCWGWVPMAVASAVFALTCACLAVQAWRCLA